MQGSKPLCCTDGGEPWKDKKRLFELHEKGHTYEQIGDKLGCSQSTVSAWMVRHRAAELREELDVEIPDDKPYQDAELMERLYVDEELSTTEVAAVLDCSTGAVIDWLGRLGIGTRSRSEGVSISKGGPKDWYFYSNKVYGHETIKPNRDTAVLIHRLLAVSEFGFEAVKNMSVHHINGIPWDNRPDNIELVSRSDHRRRHQGNFTWLDHLRALEMYDECRSSYKVAEVIGCAPRTVRDWIHEIDPDMIDPPGAKPV